MSMVQYYGGVVMLASDLLPFLKVYAASFFVIPLLRWLWIKNKNMKIDSRNEVKLQNAVRLPSNPRRDESHLVLVWEIALNLYSRYRRWTDVSVHHDGGRIVCILPVLMYHAQCDAIAQDYLLQSPASRQKLMDASRLASEDVISRDRIVFKSNETIEDMDLNDFDEQLKSG